MTAAPSLSVLMPTLDGAPYIEAALQSLVEQDGGGLEVIIVDAGSTDGTREIVAGFAGRLDLRVLDGSAIRNWAAQTNLAAQQARAQHLCILHQDDLWLPQRGATVQRLLRDYPDAALYLHPAHFIDTRGKRLGTWRCPLPPVPAAIHASLMRERLLVQNFIAMPAPTFARSDFLAVGGLDPELWYTADWDLYLKLASRGAVHYWPEPLACFRVHSASQTIRGSRNLADFREQLLRVLRRHLDGDGAPISAPVRRAARFSVEMNTLMAGIGHGGLLHPEARRWAAVLAGFASLGPAGLASYCRAARLLERVRPRLAAGLM